MDSVKESGTVLVSCRGKDLSSSQTSASAASASSSSAFTDAEINALRDRCGQLVRIGYAGYQCGLRFMLPWAEPHVKPKSATFPLPLHGLKNNDLRDFSLDFDNLARVDGSARFGFGKSTAKFRLCAENPSKAMLDVHATESKSLASDIASALTPSLILTLNPRTLVQLVVQALSLPPKTWKDGLTAAMINVSTLAFLNASSIPMKVVCAVTVGRLASENQFIVDPSGEEAAFGCGWMLRVPFRRRT
ncbi:hypothetical protein F5146DRAFT_1132552 [Armillaria mellea]|nr:hypothetical protein F5146DRAFT_1132552 [Armillaria mellea]